MTELMQKKESAFEKINAISQRFTKAKLKLEECELFLKMHKMTTPLFPAQSKTEAKSGTQALNFVLSKLQTIYPQIELKEMNRFRECMFHLHVIDALELAFSNVQVFSEQTSTKCDLSPGRFDLLIAIKGKDPDPILVEFKRYREDQLVQLPLTKFNLYFSFFHPVLCIKKGIADMWENGKNRNNKKENKDKFYRTEHGNVPIEHLMELAGTQLSQYCNLPSGFDSNKIRREVVALVKSEIRCRPSFVHKHN